MVKTKARAKRYLACYPSASSNSSDSTNFNVRGVMVRSGSVRVLIELRFKSSLTSPFLVRRRGFGPTASTTFWVKLRPLTTLFTIRSCPRFTIGSKTKLIPNRTMSLSSTKDSQTYLWIISRTLWRIIFELGEGGDGPSGPGRVPVRSRYRVEMA